MTTTGQVAAQTDGRLQVVHEHGWLVESRHPTSQGWVVYVRCAVCGARRLDLQPVPGAVPQAGSVVVPSADGLGQTGCSPASGGSLSGGTR